MLLYRTTIAGALGSGATRYSLRYAAAVKRLALIFILATFVAGLVYQIVDEKSRNDDFRAGPASAEIGLESEQATTSANELKSLALIAGDRVDDPKRVTKTSFGCDLDDVGTNLEDIASRMATMADALSTANNAEYLLAAALLSGFSDPISASDYTNRALQIDPSHPLVFWFATGLCQQGGGGDFCRAQGFANKAHSVLGRNGAYWARVAARHNDDGDPTNALAALKRASIEPEFDFYVADFLLLIERGLAAQGDMNYAERVSLALAFTPVPGMHSDIYEMCSENIDADAVWLEACTDYAHRLASESKTIMNRLIGYGMLKQVFKRTGRSDELKNAHADWQSLRDNVNGVVADLELLMLADERFTIRYVDEFAANGELAAIEFAHAEVGRLKADASYDPCAMAERRNLER